MSSACHDAAVALLLRYSTGDVAQLALPQSFAGDHTMKFGAFFYISAPFSIGPEVSLDFLRNYFFRIFFNSHAVKL